MIRRPTRSTRSPYTTLLRSPVAVASMLNKQQPFGGDVISRISATMLDPTALSRLQAAACETLAELAEQVRSEEHTSELQSLQFLVCRLLLEKKRHMEVMAII